MLAVCLLIQVIDSFIKQMRFPMTVTWPDKEVDHDIVMATVASEERSEWTKALNKTLKALRALGEVYLERSNPQAGLKALGQARDLAPEDVPTRRALARALVAQGDLAGAIRELRAAHQQGAEASSEALEEELDRLTERASARRIRQLEARLLANEDDPSLRVELADALAERGEEREAVEQLAQLAEREGQLQRATAAADGPRRIALTSNDPTRAASGRRHESVGGCRWKSGGRTRVFGCAHKDTCFC